MGNKESFTGNVNSGIPSRKKVIQFYKKHPDSGVLVDIQYGIPKFTGVNNFKNGPAIKKMINDMRWNLVSPFLPDSTFIISTADSDYAGWRKEIGKGIWLNSTQFPREAILHPLWYFVTKPHQKIIRKAKKTPWKNKMNKIIWRGSTTGKCLLDGSKEPSRAFLTEFSERFPHLIDAKFTNFTDKGKELQNNFKKAETVSPEDQQNYKYIFNIDGHGASYGLYWQLLSGSHVIRWSNHRMWFDGVTEPSRSGEATRPLFQGTMTEIHYPEQLLPKIKKLGESTSKRKTQVAKNVSERVFNDKFVYNYLLKTIKKYARLQSK